MSANCLIDASTLRAALERGEKWLVLDCRARLEDPGAGKRMWEEGHIPGSRYFDLDRDMAAPAGEGGRHPLPRPADFTATLQRLGIDPELPAVVYDDRGGQLAAARAWWMLACWAQHPHVQVLDGGLDAWLECNGGIALERLLELPPGTAGTWQPDYDARSIIDAEDVIASEGLKIDARTPARFRGESEPIDPVAGHIPGAVCRPSTDNLAENGRFKRPERLEAELPRGEQVISYCGSGITACHNILAYAVAGRPLPKLYAGSWSHWIRDARRPVATGEQ